MDVPSNGGNAFIPPPPAMKQANGKVPPTRIFDVPADQPMSDQPHASMQKPTDLGGGAAKAPVPFLATTPMIGLAQSPNPFAPYCGPDNELTPASALCRAAGEAGLSDYCRQQLLAFLASKSSQTLGSWIAAQELCDQAALRRAVGIAEASIAAKTSAGLYRASGGMPNYWRASGYVGNPTREEWIANAGDPEQWDASFGADDATNGGGASGGGGMTAAEKGRLTAAQTADAFARGRDNPPTDYGRIIGSIGTAVGGVFAGINQAVDQAENRRIRELEVNYANNARGRELALRERGQELAGEIARLRAAPSAATDPAMATLIQRLETQGAEYRSAIQRLEQQPSQGMGTGTIVAIGVSAVAILGLGAYALMGKGGRR